MSIQCTICMSSLGANDAANAASCGHVFHESCLVQWFLQSKTCPQCRTRCPETQVRRLCFSAELNTSAIDLDSLQTDLDNAKLEVTNLRSDLDAKNNEIAKLKEKHSGTQSMIVCLNNQLETTKLQLQSANSQIASQKADLNRLYVVEATLNKKMQETKNLDYIKAIIDSDVMQDVDELLRRQPEVRILATLVSVCKKELVKVKKSRDEVGNHKRVCQAENGKLKKVIKQLTERINTLESDNYELQEDEVPVTPVTTIQSAQPSSSFIQLSTPGTARRNQSPYLNIRQNNVFVTPLLHRKRNAEAEALSGAFRNLNIFNNPRKLTKPTTGAQQSSLIYNGFGGSEREENFVGQFRQNFAGSA